MLKQKFVVHFTSLIIRSIIHAIAGIVVARIAGPEILGTVTYATSYIALFGIFLGFFGPSHIKLVSEGKDLGSCIKTYAVLQSLLISLFAIVFVTVYLYKLNVGYDYGGGTQEIVIIIIFVSSLIHSIISIVTVTFAARAEIAKQSISHLTEGVIHSVLRVVVVILGFGAVALAMTNLISVLLLIPLVYYLFRNYPIGNYNVEIAKKYLNVSIYFFIISTCTVIMNNFGKVFLKHYSTAIEVGLYTGGYSLASMLLIVATTGGTIFFPTFSRLVSENKYDTIAFHIQRYQRFLFIFIMPFVIIISNYSDLIINLVLGEKYIDSIPILAILIISSFVIILTLPYANLITGSGRVKQAALIGITQVIIFILMLFVFVSDRNLNMGAYGLAMAVLIAYIYTGLSYYLYSKSFFKYNNSKYTGTFLLFGLLCYISLRIISNIPVIHESLYSTIMIIPGFLFLYYILCYLLNFANKDDLKEMINLIKPSLSSNYIKSEISNKVNKNRNNKT